MSAPPAVELLAWVETPTARRSGPPPLPVPRDEAESWIEPERRRVRAGGRAVPVEVVADGSRLALAVRALARIPEDLSPERRAWLEAICRDTETRCRVVRVGVDAEAHSVRAEVDLTGAPVEWARELAELALAALELAAASALPALAVVTDASVRSETLGRMPWGLAPSSNKSKETA